MENQPRVIVFDNLREANPPKGTPSGYKIQIELPAESFGSSNAVGAAAQMTFDEIGKAAASFGARFRAGTTGT